jgi:DNA gyrase subunit A
MKDPNADLLAVLPAPDFPTGGELLYDRAALSEVYQTGRGSFKVRGRWRYFKEENLIEIFEIPYSTTSEAIIGKVADLAKNGKLREISDMRDETDLSGLKLTIDLKRGTDPEKLMQKLFRMTPLQDSFSCNFNILIDGMPYVLGVGDILDKWTVWRAECVRRQTAFTIQQKKDKLHLLLALRQILLDIDRAIKIIRETEEDALVLPRLMEGFSIDQIQAEYVADIRLRNINKEYILKRLRETDDLQKDIEDLEDLLQKPARIRKLIMTQLEGVKKQYGIPRRTGILYDHQTEEGFEPEEEVPNYPVHVFLSREGYLKKITPQSLRMSGEQKYKDGDGAQTVFESVNNEELLVFTSKRQCYKTRLADFEDSKASVLGEYLPVKLEMEPGETVLWVTPALGYEGSILFFFANGKIARVAAGAYQTVNRRKKLTGAYSDKSPLVAALRLPEEQELTLYSTEGRVLLFRSDFLSEKTSRSTQGVAVMTLKSKFRLERVEAYAEGTFKNPARYRSKNLPAAGALLREAEQLSIFE